MKIIHVQLILIYIMLVNCENSEYYSRLDNLPDHNIEKEMVNFANQGNKIIIPNTFREVDAGFRIVLEKNEILFYDKKSKNFEIIKALVVPFGKNNLINEDEAVEPVKLE